MTGEQKQQIFLLRKQGVSFAEIGNELGIPKNTVKTFCWRNSLSNEDIVKAEENRGYMGFCKQCGNQIEQKPRSRPKKFCCDKCRYDWWKDHENEMKRKARISKICAECGEEFLSYPSQNQKFCSHECYIHAYFYKEEAIEMTVASKNFDRQKKYCAPFLSVWL